MKEARRKLATSRCVLGQAQMSFEVENLRAGKIEDETRILLERMQSNSCVRKLDRGVKEEVASSIVEKQLAAKV